MKIKGFIVLFICLSLVGCWVTPRKREEPQEVSEKYYEFLKVNNNLTFSGVNELSKDELENREYYHFFYNQGNLLKIKSYSSLANSFHELNKYIFNINKEWKEININSSTNTKQYTFSNEGDLIKFDISYNESGLPTSFQVIPFNITYDNFKILGRSVVYAGKFIYNEKKLLTKIMWIDSNAEYLYSYDKKNNVMLKNINNNGNSFYEYRFELNKFGIVVGIR